MINFKFLTRKVCALFFFGGGFGGVGGGGTGFVTLKVFRSNRRITRRRAETDFLF
jgi:hypothetical protein